MALARGLCLALSPLLLVGCGMEDMSKAFVSNPGGSFDAPPGGTVVVTERAVLDPRSQVARALSFDSLDAQGELRIHLLTGGDLVLLERSHQVELRSPLVEGGRRSFPAARILIRDQGEVAFELLTSNGDRIEIALDGGLRWPDGERRMPPTDPAPRLRDAGSGLTQLLGPDGEVAAVLPAASIELQAAHSGLFLSASTRDRWLMATGNRYLLRVSSSRQARSFQQMNPSRREQ